MPSSMEVEAALRALRRQAPQAKLAAAARDAQGRSILRLVGAPAAAMLAAWREAVPLGQPRITFDVLRGEDVAELVVPDGADEQRMAKQIVREGRAARVLLRASTCLAILAGLASVICGMQHVLIAT